MKRLKSIFIYALLIISVVGCGKTAADGWQEQYDLGMRYLTEGNYEEAILAFTAAIEIDPKLPEAYIGRGDAYILWGESDADVMAEKNELALADYLAAIELDDKNADAYLKVAELYISLGDLESAKLLLEKGIKTADDVRLSDKLKEIEAQQEDGFFSSLEYIEFDVLTPEIQTSIANVVEAFQTGDEETVYKALQGRFPIDEQRKTKGAIVNVLRTFYSDYKIEITDFNHGEDEIDIQIEIRPETGTAYGASYQIPKRTARFEAKQFFHGECVDWNWNGLVERYYSHNSEYSFSEERESGITKDGLYNGIVKRSYRSIQNGEENIIQEEYEVNGYSTPVFNTGYESFERAKNDLWWN